MDYRYFGLELFDSFDNEAALDDLAKRSIIESTETTGELVHSGKILGMTINDIFRMSYGPNAYHIANMIRIDQYCTEALFPYILDYLSTLGINASLMTVSMAEKRMGMLATYASKIFQEMESEELSEYLTNISKRSVEFWQTEHSAVDIVKEGLQDDDPLLSMLSPIYSFNRVTLFLNDIKGTELHTKLVQLGFIENDKTDIKITNILPAATPASIYNIIHMIEKYA